MDGLLGQFLQVEQMILAELADVGAFKRAACQADQARTQPEGLAIALLDDELFGHECLDDPVYRGPRIAQLQAERIHCPRGVAAQRNGVEHPHELGERCGPGDRFGGLRRSVRRCCCGASGFH
ncbi:hypothetical protein D3C72_1846310 [compost metagenome]